MAITSSSTGIEHLFNSVPLSADLENYLFLTTNEVNSNDTVARLQRIPPVGNTVITVSGLFGLNILAARAWAAHTCGQKITNFIVIDFCSTVVSFWNDIAKIICGEPETLSSTREKVIDQIEALVKKNSSYYFPGHLNVHFSSRDAAKKELIRFREEITSGTSFASSDEKFILIQEIFRSRRFHALRLNFDNPESFQALRLILKANHLITDTAYFSNIKGWLSQIGLQEKFFESAESLLTDSTITIDSEPIESSRFHQRIQPGKFFIQRREVKHERYVVS